MPLPGLSQWGKAGFRDFFFRRIIMARCALTNKKLMGGHKVSHSNIKTKRKLLPNIQKKRVFDIETGRFVKLSISTRALRTLNKLSLSSMVRKLMATW
jgi:large subunit ribosomal protein L28